MVLDYSSQNKKLEGKIKKILASPTKRQDIL